MTKEEYQEFVLRYKGCGACFPMYHTLSRFEKMWFSAIQKDVTELEKENAELKEKLTEKVTLESLDVVSAKINDLEKENAELKHNKKTVVHLADCLEEKMKERIEELEQQIEKMKRHCNCKHRDSEGYCEVKRTYLMDLSYGGCDKWELED